MSRRALLILAAIGVLAAVLVAIRLTGDEAPRTRLTPAKRTVGRAAIAQIREAGELARRHGGSAAPLVDDDEPGEDGTMLAVAGSVLDVMSDDVVGGVEVVFRSAVGETSVVTGPDGTYRIALARGAYRAFVRDDAVLSIGAAARVRIPGAPTPDQAGLPDEALMPLVDVNRDLDGIDLAVVRGGRITGTVTGAGGKPVAGAIVRAQGGVRSALGTDLVETDAAGRFDLRVATGGYRLEVSHARYASTAEPAFARVAPGGTVDVMLALARGCIIAGTVTAASGRPANEGAIEQKWGEGVNGFGPAGRIEADGRFRYTTLDEGPITLRAWPWKSAPSVEQTFPCTDGARYDTVAFRIPERRPDVEGVLVDAKGAPVAFTYVDFAPLEEGGMAQQERTDAEGRWAVFSLPAGRYRATAQAAGRGLLVTEVTSPRAGVRLALLATGSLEGTVPGLATGAFQLELMRCLDASHVDLARERRYVRVERGRFRVEGLPACRLAMAAHWRGTHVVFDAELPPNGTTTVEVARKPLDEADADSDDEAPSVD